MKEFDPTDIEAIAQAREEKALTNKVSADNDSSDFKWLMSTKRGRRIVWRQLDRAGVFKLSFSTNAMQMSFAEGNRNEGLRTLLQIHTLCPELYSTMIKESNDRNSNNIE